MDSVLKESHVVETVAQVRDEKNDRLLLHPIRRQNSLKAKDNNPHRDHAINRKTHVVSVKFHAD